MVKRNYFSIPFILIGITQLSIGWASPSQNVHLGYHWHLHQPIYWPAPIPNSSEIQCAADSFDLKALGGGIYPGSTLPHPQNNLAWGDQGSYDAIFTQPDRVAIYQDRGQESIATLYSYPDAGASISYSGSLMDNIQSWGKNSRFGYRPHWYDGYRESLRWKTSGGFPKGDLVGFTYHHSLAPLLSPKTFQKELQFFKQKWLEIWNGNSAPANFTKGFFPTEVAFSETLIPILAAEGYEWSIIANGHLARTCENYLNTGIAPMHSTETWNTNPPNAADLQNPAVPARQWWSGSLDGRGAKIPAPFAYQPHQARHIDPETGKETSITLIPMDEVLSYMNGYSSMDTSIIDQKIAPWNNQNQPSLVLFAHDGDNAWGGGYSYYHDSVQGLANDASKKNYKMTTIQQYLSDHPVKKNEFTHIEDGGWVNPEGDWGDPQFVKWLYPPARSPNDPKYRTNDPRSWIDIENGFSSSWRSWAIINAGANLCEMAEQVGGEHNPNVQKAWTYYLAGLDSGFLYYGDSLDDPVKQSLALNEALPYIQAALGNSFVDLTPPTIFKPQRWPYNPGGIGWGVTTQYHDIGLNGKAAHSSDFYIWTFIYDYSSVPSVLLKTRTSTTGTQYPNHKDYFTYLGGPSVTSWKSTPMSPRTIDTKFTGNPPNPKLNYFILPKVISDHYWAKVTGYHDVLMDYYIEAKDSAGNISKSEIAHVWIGPYNN